jgi:hypothetical protein
MDVLQPVESSECSQKAILNENKVTTEYPLEVIIFANCTCGQ